MIWFNLCVHTYTIKIDYFKHNNVNGYSCISMSTKSSHIAKFKKDTLLKSCIAVTAGRIFSNQHFRVFWKTVLPAAHGSVSGYHYPSLEPSNEEMISRWDPSMWQGRQAFDILSLLSDIVANRFSLTLTAIVKLWMNCDPLKHMWLIENTVPGLCTVAVYESTPQVEKIL